MHEKLKLSPDPCETESLSPSSNQTDIMLTNKNFADVNPLLAGQRVCDPSYSYGPYIKSYYLLHYVVSGKGVVINNQKEYVVTKDQLFISQPQAEIVHRADSKEPWHYRWVGFQCSSQLAPAFLKKNVIYAPKADYIFHSLMNADHFNSGRELYVCSKIFELFALLSQNTISEKNRPSNYTQMAKNYIESNFNDPILSIQILSEKLNLDRCYLSTIFKEHIGQSPQQYLQDFRLNHAAKMISENSHKVLEVARACGYNSDVHFSKMFKQKFGVGPKRYSQLPSCTKNL